MPDLLNDILFLFQRLTWVSLLDLFLVTMVFYTILMLVRDTQAVVLLRGVILLIILLSLLTSLVDLPAFSWLIQTALPALVSGHPGYLCAGNSARAGTDWAGRFGYRCSCARPTQSAQAMQATIHAVVSCRGAAFGSASMAR